MIVGEGFKGIIRTLRVLNWPKLDIHFKGEYIDGMDCKRYADGPYCDICSPKYQDGTCFPHCDLDQSPSIANA
jgi:hypothetical protein